MPNNVYNDGSNLKITAYYGECTPKHDMLMLVAVVLKSLRKKINKHEIIWKLLNMSRKNKSLTYISLFLCLAQRSAFTRGGHQNRITHSTRRNPRPRWLKHELQLGKICACVCARVRVWRMFVCVHVLAVNNWESQVSKNFFASVMIALFEEDWIYFCVDLCT